MATYKPIPSFDEASLRIFWGRVNKSGHGGCWLWNGKRHRGYGVFRNLRAHRISYALLRGQLSTELTLDHLCRVRHCVNPDHLEPVTAGVNALRGEGPAALNARKTHCPRGHHLAPDNTVRRSSGRRNCRQCANELRVERRRLSRKPAPTHCPRGHEWTPENTRYKVSRHGNPHRYCRPCMLAYGRMAHARRMAKRNGIYWNGGEGQ